MKTSLDLIIFLFRRGRDLVVTVLANPGIFDHATCNSAFWGQHRRVVKNGMRQIEIKTNKPKRLCHYTLLI
jgi:uncharacterized protein (UPF0371 family)